MTIDKLFMDTPGLLRHSLRVLFFVRHTIDYLPDGLISRLQAEDLMQAALFHDIGKSTWPAAWFTRPRRSIRNADWTVMQTHPIQGVNVLKSKEILINKGVKNLILEHHERPGRRGYPYQVEPEFVSLVLASCDVFAGCTEDRPYRSKQMAVDNALEEVAQFAPTLVVDALQFITKKIA